MTETLNLLVERYGLIAVFVGCMAEGESAAILAGFFVHQHVFVAWQAFGATAFGAFLGDVLFFLAGRGFSDHPYVRKLRERPGFSHAQRMVTKYPSAYVFLNRYVYGFRLVGGVAAGMAGIPLAKFVVLNALSALLWAAIFGSLGYLFGLGAEQLIGRELGKHHRLLIALGIGIAAVAAAVYIAHRRAGRAAEGDSK